MKQSSVGPALRACTMYKYVRTYVRVIQQVYVCEAPTSYR